MAVAAVLLSGVLWGCMPLYVRYLTGIGLHALQICAVRFMVAGILLVTVLLLYDRKALHVRLRDLPLLAFLGVVGMLVMSALYYSAMNLTTASTAAVLLYTSPIFILIFSCAWLGEPFTVRKAIALGMSFFGCVFVSGLFGGGAAITLTGFLAGLGSGLFYASYSIFGRVALRRYRSVTVTAYAFVFAGLGALFFLDIPVLTASVQASASSTASVLMMAALAVCGGVAPAMLYTYGLARMDAGRAGILVCVEPMTATLISVTVLRESCAWYQWIGIGLILAAVLLLQSKGRSGSGNRVEGEGKK